MTLRDLIRSPFLTNISNRRATVGGKLGRRSPALDIDSATSDISSATTSSYANEKLAVGGLYTYLRSEFYRSTAVTSTFLPFYLIFLSLSVFLSHCSQNHRIGMSLWAFVCRSRSCRFESPCVLLIEYIIISSYV